MQALLAALLRFDLLPAGFRNRELREAVAPLRGMSLDDFRTASGIGSPPKGCASPWPTTAPRRASWAPVLSATLDGESTTRLQAAIAAYDREVGHLWEGHALAA